MIDKEKMFEIFQDMVKNAKAPECPLFFEDERFEDAFKEPETDENGYSERIPAIWHDYSYKEQANGVIIITSVCAIISSNLYSRYIDTEALVWDSYDNKLLLYLPDPENPKMAFKGSRWHFAKKLKNEFLNQSLEDIYLELSKH